MDSKQNTTLLTDNKLFTQQVNIEQKSNLRHQIDDLLFGSVIYKKKTKNGYLFS